MRPEPFHPIKFLTLAVFAGILAACTPLGKTGVKKKETAETHLQLGVRYMNLNKLDIAKENLLKAVEYDSGNAQAHNSLAVLYEKLKQYDDAEDEYETALSLKPDDVGAQNNYGRFLCERGETDKGLALLTKAGSDPLNERSWMALTNAGLCLLNKGDKQQAEPYLRQALELNKTYAPALSA
ncbi:MAG: type IV pilus biogenesis/stability protein PilW, partial [Methylobacter sp.]